MRNCFRLGKYQSSPHHPRPILVKFNNIKVVKATLSLSQSRQSPSCDIVIKQDLSKGERCANAILLKEQYRLISEEKIDKFSIMFRGDKIYINNRPRGEVKSNNFVTFPSLEDLAPSL